MKTEREKNKQTTKQSKKINWQNKTFMGKWLSFFSCELIIDPYKSTEFAGKKEIMAQRRRNIVT